MTETQDRAMKVAEKWIVSRMPCPACIPDKERAGRIAKASKRLIHDLAALIRAEYAELEATVDVKHEALKDAQDLIDAYRFGKPVSTGGMLVICERIEAALAAAKKAGSTT